MAEYQLLRCSVALAGDREQVVVRGRHSPILFPELVVLQHIHGEDAITDVHVVGTCEMEPAEAWTRLLTLYGEDPVKAVFPGARPHVPRSDPSGTVPFCSLPVYVPEPSRPASPEPILRPLTNIMVPSPNTHIRYATRPLPEPTPDEMAAHVEDMPVAIDDKELEAAGLASPSLMHAGRPAYPAQTAAKTRPVPDAAMVVPPRRSSNDGTKRRG